MQKRQWYKYMNYGEIINVIELTSDEASKERKRCEEITGGCVLLVPCEGFPK